MKKACMVEFENGILTITELHTDNVIGKIRCEGSNPNLTSLIAVNSLHPELFDVNKQAVVLDLRYRMVDGRSCQQNKPPEGH